jgi:hypothetical protein
MEEPVNPSPRVLGWLLLAGFLVYLAAAVLIVVIVVSVTS